MIEQSKQMVKFTMALTIFSIGCIAGHYHGKSDVYEGLMGGGIECQLGVNPITDVDAFADFGVTSDMLK